MSETLFKSFAIVGAGPHIGIPIVKAFLAIGAPILVIARPTSTNTSALPDDDPNLKVVRADYTSASEVSAILRENKVEVLISTVTLVFGGVAVQDVLADAAKEAGVKLFVPSEFGTPSPAVGLTHEKHAFAAYAKSIGLPTLRVYNGIFDDFVPWLTGVSDTGKFHIVGKGDMQGSFTAISDAAGYVAHILTTQPPSRLLDVEVHIEGQRTTLSEISALYKGTVPVVHCDALPAGVPGAEMGTKFQQSFDVGRGSSGWNPDTEMDDAELASRDNSLWEGHRWLTIGEVLGL
jgi:NAD(P)-dependent dehydrogenase (short-subunit alcohol dehydrogenase family)